MKKIVLIILMLFSCYSCKIFQSDKTKNLSHFSLQNLTDLNQNWNISYGNFYFSNEILCCRNIPKDSMIPNYKKPWRTIISKKSISGNYSFEFDFKLITSQLIEMVINLDTIQNHYTRIYVYEIEHNIHIGIGDWKKSDVLIHGISGGGRTLKTGDISIKQGEWNHFKIQYSNNTYSIFYNSKHVFTYQDNKKELSVQGLIGILSNNEADIKNIKIKKL